MPIKTILMPVHCNSGNNTSERFTKIYLRTIGLKLILLSINQSFSASSGNFCTISIAPNGVIFDPNLFLRLQLLNLYGQFKMKVAYYY